MPLTLSTSAMLSKGWPWPSPNYSDLASRSFSVKINLESMYCVLHVLARAFLAAFMYMRGQLNMLKKTHWSLFIHSCSVIALTKRVLISITFLKSKLVFVLLPPAIQNPSWTLAKSVFDLNCYSSSFLWTQETHRPRVNVVFLVPSAPSLIISGLSQNIAFEFFMKSIVFYSVTFWIWNHTDQGPGCFKVVCNSGCLILSVERCITRDLCNTFFELNIWRRDGPSDHIPNWSSAILWACNYQRV